MGIKESIDGLSEDLREILSSTAAARGPEMANAVAITFEARQLVDLVRNLAHMVERGNEEYATHLVGIAQDLLTAMLSKALAHLGQEKIEEALKMSEQLDQRRDRVIDSVLQIMEGGNGRQAVVVMLRLISECLILIYKLPSLIKRETIYISGYQSLTLYPILHQ
jgi:hypothetical protein